MQIACIWKKMICFTSSSAVEGLKPVMMMVVTQIAYAGLNIFFKLVADVGMNFTVLIAYRNMFSAAVMIPLALIFERKSSPKLTPTILFQAFLSGLFGATLAQNLFIESIALTSATFAAAITNCVPAVTFLVAISFRLEKLTIGTHAGMAKVMGTLVGLGGTILFTFYKGKEIAIWSTHVNLLHSYHPRQNGNVASSHKNTGSHLIGSSLALGSTLSSALWLIVQAKMGKKYPFHYSSTALMSIMASIQSVAFALCKERNWSQWKLGWDIKLFTAVYSGIVATGLVVTLTTWCVHIRGPLFVSTFNPLSLLLVALVGPLLLEEKLYVGSILGGILIVSGLYMVLWGKSKEMKMMMIQLQSPSRGFQDPPICSIQSVNANVNRDPGSTELSISPASMDTQRKN